jgi:hypothetical protein
MASTLRRQVQVQTDFRSCKNFATAATRFLLKYHADRYQISRAVTPGLSQVGRIFLALREHFDVTAQGSVSRWTLELKPCQEHVAHFLAGLMLSGDRFIEEIRIDEASGDSTRILFSQSRGDDKPTGDEARFFEGQ